MSTKQLIAIAIEALLVPHVVVMAFVYTHFSKDSVLFYTLMFYCGMSTFVELKLLRNTLRQQRGRERYSLRYVNQTKPQYTCTTLYSIDHNYTYMYK